MQRSDNLMRVDLISSLFDWIEIQTNSSKKYFKTWIEINCITKRCEKQNWNSSPTTRINCTGCLKLKWQIKAFVSFYLQRLLMQQLERKRVKMLKNLWNISHVRWHSHFSVPRSFCSAAEVNCIIESWLTLTLEKYFCLIISS